MTRKIRKVRELRKLKAHLDLQSQVVSALLECLEGHLLTRPLRPAYPSVQSSLGLFYDKVTTMLIYVIGIVSAYPLALRMPKPNSALSSKRELAHAGPSPGSSS